MAALTSAEESNTLVAIASLEAVAVAARVVAVKTGAPASVTYTTGRTKTSVGAGTEIAAISIEVVDWAPAKAARAATAESVERMVFDPGDEVDTDGGKKVDEERDA
jgi:hypothetical protein